MNDITFNNEKFRCLITDKGITSKILAKETDISEATISDIINDVDKGYNYKYFIKIAKYFGVTVDYLLGLTDVKTPDADIMAVCDYTGLNENSVNVLHQLANTKNDILTFINRSLNSLLQSNKKDRSAQHTETVKGK